MYLHINNALTHAEAVCTHTRSMYCTTAQNTCGEVQCIVSKPTHLLSECQYIVEDTWIRQLS